jgi:O-acetylserine/cysteine efflux transporter
MVLVIRPLRLALFLIVAALWGPDFAVAKIGLKQLPPILLTALRWGNIAPILAPFAQPMCERWRGVFLVSVTLGIGIITVRRPRLVAPDAERV